MCTIFFVIMMPERIKEAVMDKQKLLTHTTNYYDELTLSLQNPLEAAAYLQELMMHTKKMVIQNHFYSHYVI